MKRFAVFVYWMACASVAFAATLDPSLIQTSGFPSVGSDMFYGYWTSSVGPGDNAFSNAFEKAVSEDVPLVVIWSNEGCSHCDAFISDLNTNQAEVKAWLSSQEAVFAFFKDYSKNERGQDVAPTEGHEPKACYDAWHFASTICKAKASWPLFGFYYRLGNGNARIWGTEKSTSGSTRTWENFKENYENWIKRYGIARERSGKFVATGEKYDRYEADPATEYLDVELARDSDLAGYVVTNKLDVVRPGETAAWRTTNIVWAVSETAKTVRVSLARAEGEAFREGEISLQLRDRNNHVKAATPVVCRAFFENSNNNPLWLGEKNAEELGWGEWTMDLDVATGKVALAEGEAFTLVCVQGSRWCPDCANTDANFLGLADEQGDNRFRRWAESNHVALAVVDIPNYGERDGTDPETCRSPSMFSRTAYAANGALRSGRYYLSRKMISDEDARSMRARCHFLASSNTDKGGFHRPEDPNPYRTGVPTFVLLRKDGSVAARLVRFSVVSPGAADQANWGNFIARFDEMLKSASDSGEIANNHWSSTSVVLQPGKPVKASVCHVDTSDVAVISDASPGVHVKLSLDSESTNKVSLAILSETDGVLRTFSSAYGSFGGLSLEAELDEADRWFAHVSCENSGQGFAVDEAASTVAAYSLSAEYFIKPQEKAATNVPSGDYVIVRVEEGELYRFSGIALPVAGLEEVGDGLLRATVSADLRMQIAEGATAFTYQLWHPGEAVFVKREQAVYTRMGNAALKVARTGGTSGRLTVPVRLVHVDEYAEGRFVWSEDVSVIWQDGESGEKTVELGINPPGDAMHSAGKLFFEVGRSELVVTLLDTDAPGLELLDYESSTYRYFSAGLSFGTVNLLSGGHVSVRVLSGAIPQGTRLQYDEVAGEVRLQGEPVVAGDYEFTVALAEIRGGRYVVGPASSIRVKVVPTDEFNPYLTMARANETLPLLAERGGTNIIAGTLSLAITSRGKISARYMGTEVRTAAFSGSWQELDEVGGTACTRLEKDGCTLDLEMDKSGTIQASLSLPARYSYFAGSHERIEMNAVSAWPENDALDAYVGLYNVALPADAGGRPDVPRGTGILVLRMAPDSAARAGRFVYSGFMPDGTPISGSATGRRTLELGKEFVRVPVFRRTGKSVFSAVFAIDPEAALNWDSTDDPLKRESVHLADGTLALSLHRDATWEWETVHSMAAGSYYLPGVSPLELSKMYSSLDGSPIMHRLCFDADGMDSPVFGRLSVPEADIEPSLDAMTLAQPVKDLTFTFRARAGLFSGAAVVTFVNEDGKKKKVTGSYRGVLTPGWTSGCGCATEVPEWYFGSGFLRYRDFNAAGRAVLKSIPARLSPSDGF